MAPFHMRLVLHGQQTQNFINWLDVTDVNLQECIFLIEGNLTYITSRRRWSMWQILKFQQNTLEISKQLRWIYINDNDLIIHHNKTIRHNFRMQHLTGKIWPECERHGVTSWLAWVQVTENVNDCEGREVLSRIRNLRGKRWFSNLRFGSMSTAAWNTPRLVRDQLTIVWQF